MNDAGVILMMVVDFDGVVVVELDDDFDELPQADNARAAAATVAIATTLFFLEWLLFKAPNCGLFTSVSCRMAVAIASVPGRGGCMRSPATAASVFATGAGVPVRQYEK